jgi:hypothetical protein
MIILILMITMITIIILILIILLLMITIMNNRNVTHFHSREGLVMYLDHLLKSYLSYLCTMMFPIFAQWLSYLCTVTINGIML